MIRLLHFGDMHLDSPFSSVSVAAGEKLRAELRSVFKEIISLASDFDAVLIAGDLFDHGYVAPDTVNEVRDVLGSCGKPVIIAPGNHDPYTAGSIWKSVVWPENVRIFSSDTLSSFEFEAGGVPVTVWGWAFTSDRLDRCPLEPDSIPADNGRVNILCAHADTQSPISKYCPLPPSLIASSGCVYAALGHVHNPPEPLHCGMTVAAYCGFPEGRSFDETGKGGVLSVTVENGSSPVIEKILTCHHTYHILRADITGTDGDADACRRLYEICAGEHFTSDTSLRIYLDGSVPPDYVPGADSLSAALSAVLEEAGIPVVSVEILDRTSPVYGADYLLNDLSIRGELYRTLLPSLSSSDPEEREKAAYALRIGLLALDGKAYT